MWHCQDSAKWLKCFCTFETEGLFKEVGYEWEEGWIRKPKFSDIHCVDKVNWPPQRSVSTIDDVWILFEEGLAFESRLPSTVKPPSSGQYSRGTGKWPINGGWPINRGSSYLAEHNYNLKQKLLFILSQTRYGSQSSSSISDCIFLLHILETKRN